MTFPALTARMPDDVGDLEVRLSEIVNPREGEASKQVAYSLQIVDAEGRVIPRLSNNPRLSTAGDLLPHLTNDEKVWLAAFIDRLRALARLELLGKE